MLRTLAETSEKTIEINVLSEIANSLRPSYFVTILGPTLQQERSIGFDDILAGLPPGRTVAFMFKRPIHRADGHPRFIINVDQLQVLLGNFSQGEAFFVFCPLERTQDFINAHHLGTLLSDSAPLDIHQVPFATKVSKRSRTVKYLSPNQLEITDPQKYIPVEGVWPFERLIRAIETNDIGRRNFDRDKVQKEVKERYPGPIYYAHVAHRKRGTSTQSR